MPVLRRGGVDVSGSLVPYQKPERLPAPVSRELSRIRHQAITQAARIRGTEFVAEQGMFSVASLADLEGRLIQMVPLAEPRLRAIVDIASFAITAEVAGMSGRLS